MELDGTGGIPTLECAVELGRYEFRVVMPRLSRRRVLPTKGRSAGAAPDQSTPIYMAPESDFGFGSPRRKEEVS